MKKLMKKQLLLLLFLVSNSYWGFSQVTGISYTISPLAEYTWWDNQAGLEDGLLLGGQVGIGFGQYLELQASYLQAINLKTNFTDFGIENFSEDAFTSREVKLTRVGGELKANLSSGKFLPFITLGTGVQSITMDTFAKQQQIYLDLGAGIKLSFADRFTVAVAAKNTPFNFNAGRYFLTEADQQALDVSSESFTTKQLRGNWALHASLQVYLGGRRPNELSELDKAYRATFSDGLRGLRVPIEPTLARVNFNKDLAYRDAWMLGAYAGVDFNAYIGVRAFYLRAMEDNIITTRFDNLSMFGGELRLKLSGGKSITPFLIVGGGYMNVDEDKYVSKDSSQVKSQAFASGGLGLTLPITKRFNIFGSAKALLTSGSNVENLEGTDDVKTSMMYSVGLRFIIGKKADPTAVLNAKVDAEVDAALAAQKRENEAKSKALKLEYEKKIVSLEKDLNEAYTKKDLKKAAALLKEKEDNEKVVAELEKREQRAMVVIPREADSLNVVPAKNVEVSNSRIQMTPLEFENLIEEILESTAVTNPNAYLYADQQLEYGSTAKQADLEKRIAAIEQILLQMNERAMLSDSTGTQKIIATPKPEQSSATETTVQEDLAKFSTQLMLEIQKLEKKIEQNNEEIRSMKQANDKLNKAVAPVKGKVEKIEKEKAVKQESEEGNGQ